VGKVDYRKKGEGALEMQMLESLFARALKLEPPWAITKVDFQKDEGVIRVYIDFPRGSVFCCPACGKKVKAYDTTEKEWRHLSFFQYAIKPSSCVWMRKARFRLWIEPSRVCP